MCLNLRTENYDKKNQTIKIYQIWLYFFILKLQYYVLIYVSWTTLPINFIWSYIKFIHLNYRGSVKKYSNYFRFSEVFSGDQVFSSIRRSFRISSSMFCISFRFPNRVLKTRKDSKHWIWKSLIACPRFWHWIPFPRKITITLDERYININTKRVTIEPYGAKRDIYTRGFEPKQIVCF